MTPQRLRPMAALTAGLVLALAALTGCGVLAPVLDGQRETLERITALEADVAAARASAAEVEAAYARGELTGAERDAALAALRATVLDGLAAVREAIAATGDALQGIDLADLAREGAREAAPLLPSPWKELAILLSSLGGAGAIAARAKRQVHQERDAARVMRHEPVLVQPTPSNEALIRAASGLGGGNVPPSTMAVRRR